MKNKIILALAGLLLLPAGLFAANSATGTATVLVVSPINITHNTGSSLNFGEIANGVAGTVVVTAAGAATASGFDYYNSANAAADAFSITATDAGENFSVTLPTSVTLNNGSNTLTVDTFTATCTTSCQTTEAPYALNVGATLHVATGTQAAGTYTGNYNVTLVY